MILSVKCLGFRGKVSRYNVVVQGRLLSKAIGKFFLASMASFLSATQPERGSSQREDVKLQSLPFAPGMLPSLVWQAGWNHGWETELVASQVGSMAGHSARLLPTVLLGRCLQISDPF